MIKEEKIQENKLHILGRLSAGLIHEIRNPLSVINLNLDYIKIYKDELNPEMNECINACLESSERINQLIENFLDFSKKNHSTDEYASINVVTEKAVEIMLATCRKSNIELQTILQEDIPKVKFQTLKMLQVFLNLMTNAVEASLSGGKIILRSYKKEVKNDSFVFWEIVDNGTGIEDDDREKIFTDFYTNKETGIGIGLSVCKMLLDEHNAELEFESEFGKGSRFIIKFNIGG
ncbi:MAG: ATP-binding protein [Ignavibacteria bacterium]|jgi:signal transduction histidine kinase|nr:ATP-binding protein [Ignavibacteria bacterium]